MFRKLACLSTIVVITLVTGCATVQNRNLAHQHISTLNTITDLEARREAAFQLSAFDNVDKTWLPCLIQSAKDNDTIVREFSIKTIGKMDPQIDGVTSSLMDGLRDPSLSVRRASAAIFSTMNPVPTVVLHPLAQTLADQDSLLNSFVTATFIDIGIIGVNALVVACKNKKSDELLRLRAVTILGKIGYEAKRALPTLNELLQDESMQIRTAAQQSISQIENSYAYQIDND